MPTFIEAPFCTYPDTGKKTPEIQAICQQPCVLLTLNTQLRKNRMECIYYVPSSEPIPTPPTLTNAE